jgi:hypothetical protein
MRGRRPVPRLATDLFYDRVTVVGVRLCNSDGCRHSFSVTADMHLAPNKQRTAPTTAHHHLQPVRL